MKQMDSKGNWAGNYERAFQRDICSKTKAFMEVKKIPAQAIG